MRVGKGRSISWGIMDKDTVSADRHWLWSGMELWADWEVLMTKADSSDWALFDMVFIS
jgi:hypothetical protein